MFSSQAWNTSPSNSAGPPVFAKSRNLDPEKLEIARLEFAAMEKAGIVRLSVLHGPVLLIWFGRRMDAGDLVVIIGGSIMSLFQIGILFQTF